MSGTVLMVEDGDKKHYYFKDEFKPKYDEAGTLLSIISDNKFIVQKVFYSDITNGNTETAFVNGGAVRAFIEAFIDGVGEPEPEPEQLATPVLNIGVISERSIALNWQAVANATSYTLKKNGVVLYTGPGLNYTNTNLSPSTGYTYTLVASAPGYLNSGIETAAATTMPEQIPSPGNNQFPYTLPFTLLS
jgi:hypothetical protein